MMQAFQQHRYFRPLMALFVVYLVWGTTFGIIRIGIESYPPMVLASIRFIAVGLIMGAYCLFKGDAIPKGFSLWRQIVVGFLNFFMGNGQVYWVLQSIGSGLATTLTATTPFFMTGLSAALPPKEPIRPMALVGLAIGFLGIPLLVSKQLSHPGDVDPMFWISVGGALLMAVSWSSGSVFAKKNPTDTPLLMAVAIQNLFAGLCFLPVSIALGQWNNLHPTMESTLALLYLIFLGSIVAFTCYLYMLQKLPVSVSSTFSYVNPLVAMVFGGLVLHESITPPMMLGMGVIMLGVFIVQFTSLRPVKPKSTDISEMDDALPPLDRNQVPSTAVLPTMTAESKPLANSSV